MPRRFGQILTAARAREAATSTIVSPARVNIDDLRSTSAVDDKINVLQASLEYGSPGKGSATGVGGIGAFLESIALSHRDKYRVDNRVIMPYYQSILGEVDGSYETVGSIDHCFDGKKVTSTILRKTNAEGIDVYYVKPDDEYESLFSSVTTSAQIYSDVGESKFIQRSAYFTSCVGAFSMIGAKGISAEGDDFVPHITQAHGWGLSLLGQLVDKMRKKFLSRTRGPRTQYIAHSTHLGDGSYDASEIPDIGLGFKPGGRVALAKRTICNFDHLSYVSPSLLKETLKIRGVADDAWMAYAKGSASIILNNINSNEYDPCFPGNLPDELTFDVDDIAAGKRKAKEYLNEHFFRWLGDKEVDVDNPVVLYVGRYSPEKGIESLDRAIETTLAKGASFVCMGLGSHPEIARLKEKYSGNSNVVIIDSPEHQREYGKIIRAAGDVYLVPSKIESCGIVPMEANLTGALVVSSSAGGLKDVIKPDANGTLYSSEEHMSRALEITIDKWRELSEEENLSIVQKLVQESARKTFDWESSTAGSGQEYLALYEKLISSEKASNIKETPLTQALLVYLARPMGTSAERKAELIAKIIANISHESIDACNEIGISPLQIARRTGDAELQACIERALLSHGKLHLRKPSLDDKTVTLNMTFEYKKTNYGGVSTFVSSFSNAINSCGNTKFESHAIMPYYKWHDDLVASGELTGLTKLTTVHHLFNGHMIESDVYQVMNDGEVEYLIRPAAGYAAEIQEEFAATDAGNRENIYNNIHNKTCYLSSAVAAICASPEPEMPRVDVLNAHSWGGSLAISLLKNYYRTSTPKTIQTIHSEMSEQGVHMTPASLPEIGLNFAEMPGHISLLEHGLTAADKVVYVSNELHKTAVRPLADFSLDRVCQKIDEEGRGEIILNNVSDHFNPAQPGYLGHGLSDVTSENIMELKTSVKHVLNDEILPGIEPIAGKRISDGPLFIYVGRYLAEKGIDALDSAVQAVIDKGGTFCAMGLTGNPEGDAVIRALKEKYAEHPNVIILDEATPVMQSKVGKYMRFAADVTFIPSHLESCGLVSMEAQLNGSLVVSSDVGGLNDTVFPPGADGKPVTGFKYVDEPTATESRTASITESINDAIGYLESAGERRSEIIKRLHLDAKEKYTWRGERSSLQGYLDLFRRLHESGIRDHVDPQHVATPSNIKSLGSIISAFDHSGEKELILDTTEMDKDELLLESREFTGYPEKLIKTEQGDIVAVYKLTDISHAESGVLGQGALGTISLGQILYSPRCPHRKHEFIAVKEQKFPSSCKMMNEYLIERDVTMQQGGLALPGMNITAKAETSADGSEYTSYKTQFFLTLLDGEDVQHKMRRGATLQEKINIVTDVSESLATLHSKDTLHLDLHRGNWFIDRVSNRATLLDFGTCKYVDGNKSIPVSDLSGFAPPENFDGTVSKKSDVFTIAVEMSRVMADELGISGTDMRSSKYGCWGELKQAERAYYLERSSIPDSIQGEARYIMSRYKRLLVDMLNEDENKRPSIEVASRAMRSLRYSFENAMRESKDYRNTDDVVTLLSEHGFGEIAIPDGLESRNADGYTPITWAAMQGRNDVTKTLLDAGANIATPDANGHTAVGIAQMYGDSSLLYSLWQAGYDIDANPEYHMDHGRPHFHNDKKVQELILLNKFIKENGFSRDLNAYRRDGHTPLTFACSDMCDFDPTIINILTKWGANPKGKNKYGFYPLRLALCNKNPRGMLRTLNLLISNGAIAGDIKLPASADRINADSMKIYELYQFLKENKFISFNLARPSEKGHTIASLLASRGDITELEKICSLIEKGDINDMLNSETKYGFIPLSIAAGANNEAMFAKLIELGANPFAIFGKNKTLFEHLQSRDSIASGVRDIFNSHIDDIIAEWESTETPGTLLSAANSLNQDIVIAYIAKRGIESCLSEVDADGKNIIELSLEHGDTELFEYIMSKPGIDISTVNFDRIVASLDGANADKVRAYQKVYEFLYSANKSAAELESGGATPPIYPMDINLINDYHSIILHTPLTHAVSIGDIELVNALLSMGADINARNSLGNTALHMAVDAKNHELIRLLKNQGARGDLSNRAGNSAEDMAYMKGDKILINLVTSEQREYTEEGLMDEELVDASIADVRDEVELGGPERELEELGRYLLEAETVLGPEFRRQQERTEERDIDSRDPNPSHRRPGRPT